MVKAEDINLDEELAKSQAESGITPDDLVGGKPADPMALKKRLAEQRSKVEDEVAEANADPGAGIVGEAGPAGPTGPVVDRFGPSSQGGGMIADLEPAKAKERRGEDEAANAAREAKVAATAGTTGAGAADGVNSETGAGPDGQTAPTAKEAQATAKKASAAAKKAPAKPKG